MELKHTHSIPVIKFSYNNLPIQEMMERSKSSVNTMKKIEKQKENIDSHQLIRNISRKRIALPTETLQPVCWIENQANGPQRRSLSSRKRGEKSILTLSTCQGKIMAAHKHQPLSSSTLQFSYRRKRNYTASSLSQYQQPRQSIIGNELFAMELEQFQMGELLGRGAFGNVFMARHKSTGWFYALKIIKKEAIVCQDQFISSLKLHLSVCHPHIASVYGVFWDIQNIYLLLQLCVDGNLKKLSRMQEQGKQAKVMVVMEGVAKGIKAMQEKGIRHGDLKLQNVLLCYGIPKIIDFDCASERNSFPLCSSLMMGSPLYFSPEVLITHTFSLSDDIWALSVLFYELLCGYHPFDIRSRDELNRVVQGNIRTMGSLDSQMQANLRKMLCKDRWMRMKLDEVIQICSLHQRKYL